jgi:PDZ domain-containing secreted protein
MKKLLMVAMAVMLMCSPAFADDDAADGHLRFITTTYSYDFNVSSSVTSTTVEGVTSYYARITMTDAELKKAHAGWTKAQVSSTPSLTAVTDGVTYWNSPAQTTYKAAYVLAFNESWKVGKVIQTANKLATVNGVTTFNSKTGETTIDLVTGTVPTMSW